MIANLGVKTAGKRRGCSRRTVVGVHPAEELLSAIELHQAPFSNEETTLRAVGIESFILVQTSQNFGIIGKLENLPDN
jgi:hypothetical protein